MLFSSSAFGLLIVLVLLSTIYQGYTNKQTIQINPKQLSQSSLCNQLFTSFSLIRNNKKFNKIQGKFNSINSIRFLATIDIVLIHYYTFEPLISKTNFINGLWIEFYQKKSLIHGTTSIIDVHFLTRYKFVLIMHFKQSPNCIL